MMVIARDITDRKKTEKLLAESEANARAIMESTDDVLILVDKDGILLDCNETHARRLGVSRSELLGKNIYQALPPELAESRRKAIDEAISTGQCVYGEDYRFGFWIEYAVHPICIENKTIEKVAVFARDITKRKITEQTLKENEARLRELNATKDKFFSIIAHDLKSPFNSILGLSNYMAEQVRERNYEKMEEYATIIRDSSQRAMDLLLNLLEWSCEHTGQMVFSPGFIQINSLINEVVDLLSDSAQQKSISIQKTIPSNSTAFVDRSMFLTIMRNLVSNAIKFTNPNGIIKISLEEEPGAFKISVSDNGIGIRKDRIEKLFRIDENHSTLGTQSEKGTGLGLILCKEFVEKHRGQIGVESEPGQGSTFWFTIPK
jgi:PAS domain S-box-containing protein